MISKKYNYFYKITNLLNDKFYYGVHSTNDLNDGYMGSGTLLHKAYQKYGIENFKKEILIFFDSIKEAYEYESKVVNEDLVKNQECYNIVQGGRGINTSNLATVRDKDGNVFLVPLDDPKYISGEYVGATKGFSKYLDESGNMYFLKKDDELVKCGKVFGFSKNKSIYIDKFGNIRFLDVNDERIANGEYVSIYKNKIIVKDKDGNCFSVDKDDERYKNKEVLPIWCGKKHNEETIKKMHQTHMKNGDQQGIKNSQFGTCWITDGTKNMKITKEQLEIYEKEGWKLGRTVNKDQIKYKYDDKIDVERIKQLREEGMSWDDIAKEFGTYRSTLRRYRIRHNLDD